MAAKKDFLGLVDASGQVRRTSLIGMQFLHQGAMRARDGIGARTGLHAKDLIGLLFRHFAASRSSAPRCRDSAAIRDYADQSPRRH